MDQNDQKQAALDEQALADYAEELIKAKASPHVTDANRQEIKDKLIADIADSINSKLLDSLTDDQLVEFNSLADKGADDKAISDFFKSNIPNYEELIVQALMDFRKGYLSVVYNK